MSYGDDGRAGIRMSWWKRRKCASCKKVLKKNKPVHELRLGTADGMLELEVCEDCSRFWDMSADILNKGQKEHQDEE